MANTSTCLSPVCGVTVEGDHKKCPTCGWAMRNQRNLRVRGVIVLLCGLILLGLMGTITLSLYDTLAHPERAIAAGDYTGKPQEARNALNLFFLVLAFGALATANGLFMIVTGRQNKWFVLASLAGAALLFVACYSFTNGFNLA